MSSKAVFFDRDKTIIIPNENNYIYRVGDFYIPEEFTKALKSLYEKGYKLFVVTNQGRIAKGYMTEKDVMDVHEYINDHFKEHGFHIEKFAYCPHDPIGDVYPYNVVCSCRKPKNGMIKMIIEENDIDISLSWMVGDTERDVIAGNMTGLRTILVRTGIRHDSENADFVADDLVGAVAKIIECDR
ncbi:MAG: D-glycero-alpha-D-manno-heptose-1,7-bisphosphate 7-phosphatase [Thermodesulfobacteriota bacterium]